VIVVSPSLHDPMVADVFNFNALKLIKVFNRLDEDRNGPPVKNRKRNFSIFAALDPQPGDQGDSDASNLMAHASWIASAPLSGPEVSTSPVVVAGKTVPTRATNFRREGDHEGFVERVRREYAELNGVDVKNVFINIRYVEE
jgi:hypothetical protein